MYNLTGFATSSIGGVTYEAFYGNEKICGGIQGRGGSSITITAQSNGEVVILDSFRLDKEHRQQAADHERCLMRMLCDKYAKQGFKQIRVPSVTQHKDITLYKSLGFIMELGCLTINLNGT